MDWGSIIIAAIGILSGGVGTEIVRRFFDNKDDAADDLADVKIAEIEDDADNRSELWAEINKLRASVDELYGELDKWKEKYFDEVRDKAASDARYKILHNQFVQLDKKHRELKEGYEILKQDHESLKKTVRDMQVRIVDADLDEEVRDNILEPLEDKKQ